MVGIECSLVQSFQDCCSYSPESFIYLLSALYDVGERDRNFPEVPS